MKAVLSANPEASCRGIDLDASQADRYNNEANKAYGDNAESKMFGIQGDLYHPSENMNGPDWENFDVAVISMALHHVADPIDMLRRLRQRLRPGGVLIVVEFLGKEEEAKGSEGYDPRNMVEVVHKQKIWPGFTTGNLEGNMKRAGFEDFEVKKLETPAYVPPEASGGRMDTEMWPFFAKATVAESASL